MQTRTNKNFPDKAMESWQPAGTGRRGAKQYGPTERRSRLHKTAQPHRAAPGNLDFPRRAIATRGAARVDSTISDAVDQEPVSQETVTLDPVAVENVQPEPFTNLHSGLQATVETIMATLFGDLLTVVIGTPIFWMPEWQTTFDTGTERGELLVRPRQRLGRFIFYF